MKKKFKLNCNSKEVAFKLFEDYAIQYGQAIDEFKFSLGNKRFNKVVAVLRYIFANGYQFELRNYLKHDNLYVRFWAASYLVQYDGKKCIKVLKEISKKGGPALSGYCDIGLIEWKEGNLDAFKLPFPEDNDE